MNKAANVFNRVFALAMLITVISLIATSSYAQSPNKVFKGVVTGQGTGYVVIRTEDGLRHQVLINDNTHLFKDSPEFSIANIDKLVLQRANLKVGNRVEVVARNTEAGYCAGIITVMSPDPRWKQTVAARK